MAVPQHREQDQLFLPHVADEILVHALEVRGQSARAVRAAGVHAFHAVRELDQFGQLPAMAVVIPRQDVVDELSGRRPTPVAFGLVARVPRGIGDRGNPVHVFEQLAGHLRTPFRIGDSTVLQDARQIDTTRNQGLARDRVRMTIYRLRYY